MNSAHLPASQPASLVARGLRYPGRVSLDEFELKEGQCTVLCGPNGSGKSSVLRLLAGLDRAPEGQVCIGDQDIESLSRAQRSACVAWLPQRPGLSAAMRCVEVVASARFRLSEPGPIAEKHARSLLSEGGLPQLSERLTTEVSGGELQRVLLIALAAQETPLVLVDEPANHLDPAHQIHTYRQLGRMWQAGKGLLIVSHDVRLARLLGQPSQVRVLGMSEGRLVADSPLDAPDLPQILEQLYGVPFLGQGDRAALSIDLLQAEGQ